MVRWFLRQVQRSNGRADQLLDARLARRIGDRSSSGCAITKQSLLFSTQLAIQIAARQLKEWI
jgi:hypothetical protein